MNVTFSSVVNKNWAVLHSWSSYIEDNADDKETLTGFIDARRSDWDFTNFYFISEDGTGMLLNGETQPLGIDPVKMTKIKAGHDVALDGVRSDDQAGHTLFMIPVDETGVTEPRRYGDFEYIALGLTFNSADMTNTLSIKAFEGKGRCYIVDTSGNLLMSSSIATEHFANFIDHLRDDGGTVKSGTVEDIASDIQNGKRDVRLFHIHDQEFYLTTLPVDFNGWSLLGVVPSEVLNSSMNNFRTVTVAIMVCIFVLLAGGVIAVLAYGNKRRMHEKELQLNLRDDLFDLLTMNTNDIFILFSPEDFTAQYVSPNLERVLGLNQEEVKADIRKILAAVPERDDSYTREKLLTLKKNSTSATDCRMKNVSSDEEYWFKITLYHSEFNHADSFVMMLSDRTMERSMNDQLTQALDIARAANNAKTNFLSNMSHDIRTPMNAIIGFTTLLAKDANRPDKVLEYVHKIAFSSQHLLGLINDVLDTSKIESGKTSLNMEDFALSAILEELYSIMSPQAKAKQQTLEFHTRGLLPDYVQGDKLRLNQVLINLVSNAVKYTPMNGTISVTLEALPTDVNNHAHLRFTVKDNGMGMSEEFVKTIFEPFTREDKRLTSEIQGTGLGMAITKNIVDLMGGTITVESEPEKGSTFMVELEFAVVKAEEAEEDFRVHHNVTRALVVDDEEEICLDIKELMDGTGVEISYALSGMKAVQMVKAACKKHEDFNIVLLDWKMPGMDGVETAKQIRAVVGNQIPILVLTSYDFNEIEEQARDAGIDFFLAKPFFVSNFRRAVAQLSNENKLSSVERKEISLKGMHFLAAEDNSINAEILVDILEMEGAECVVATNGKEVYEEFTGSEKGRYDLILMDVQMPVMNGYEATEAIRASGHPEAKTIPILVMTANAFADDVKQALDAGMNAHLAKPIDVEKMKEMIQKLRNKNE